MKAEKITITLVDESTGEIIERYPKTISSQVFVETFGKYLHEIVQEILELAQLSQGASSSLSSHIDSHNNPHKVTKEQIGLGKINNVDYTELSTFNSHKNSINNPHNVTKTQVGLGNVSNYSIASETEAKQGTSNIVYATPYTISKFISNGGYIKSMDSPSLDSLNIGKLTGSGGQGTNRPNSLVTRTLGIGLGNTVSASDSAVIGSGNAVTVGNAFAIGTSNSVEGVGSCAFGYGNVIHSGAQYGGAFGQSNQVKDSYGYAFGTGCIANSLTHIALGSFNNVGSDVDLLTVGMGINSSSRSNAFRINVNGYLYATRALSSTGADYAEYFEWMDGNPNGEDRVGYVVTLDGEHIRKATSTDDILGIISSNPSIIGDSESEGWKDQYLKDEWGRIIYEDAEFETGLEEKVIRKAPKLNPNWNPEKVYVPRHSRTEWSPVGLVGKLHARQDGSCTPNSYATVNDKGELTFSETITNIRVMSVVNDNIVKVFIK